MFVYNKVDTEYRYYIQLKDLEYIYFNKKDAPQILINTIKVVMDDNEGILRPDDFVCLFASKTVLEYLTSCEFILNYNENKILSPEEITSACAIILKTLMNNSIHDSKFMKSEEYQDYMYLLNSYRDLKQYRIGEKNIFFPDELFTLGPIFHMPITSDYIITDSYQFNEFNIQKKDGSVIEEEEIQNIIYEIENYLKNINYLRKDVNDNTIVVYDESETNIKISFDKTLFVQDMPNERKRKGD